MKTSFAVIAIVSVVVETIETIFVVRAMGAHNSEAEIRWRLRSLTSLGYAVLFTILYFNWK